jgi:hypothetical protein
MQTIVTVKRSILRRRYDCNRFPPSSLVPIPLRLLLWFLLARVLARVLFPFPHWSFFGLWGKICLFYAAARPFLLLALDRPFPALLNALENLAKT